MKSCGGGMQLRISLTQCTVGSNSIRQNRKLSGRKSRRHIAKRGKSGNTVAIVPGSHKLLYSCKVGSEVYRNTQSRVCVCSTVLQYHTLKCICAFKCLDNFLHCRVDILRMVNTTTNIHAYCYVSRLRECKD